jgi:hypothetical protein
VRVFANNWSIQYEGEEMEFITKLDEQIPGSVSEQVKPDPSPQDPINSGIAATRDAFERSGSS